jgi:hypothetical protein
MITALVGAAGAVFLASYWSLLALLSIDMLLASVLMLVAKLRDEAT